MKKSSIAVLLVSLTACSATPESAPAPAMPTAVPARCIIDPVDMTDREAVADSAAYYLTCIDGLDTSPTDRAQRARPYLTDAVYELLAHSTARPDRFWNTAVSARKTTTVTIERLYMENHDPNATGTIHLDRLAAASIPAAGAKTTIYTLTLEPQTDGAYRVSEIVTARG